MPELEEKLNLKFIGGGYIHNVTIGIVGAGTPRLGIAVAGGFDHHSVMAIVGSPLII